ncbi:hypothetical protein ACWGIU_10040 [Streptomyces sp. NPDC054840]
MGIAPATGAPPGGLRCVMGFRRSEARQVEFTPYGLPGDGTESDQPAVGERLDEEQAGIRP